MRNTTVKSFIFRSCLAAVVLAGAAGCGQEEPRPNIVLVVMDTVRHDLEQLAPAARPNLVALAAESTVFTNAWATAPWTVPSHASMFTGKLPAGHHCTHQNPHLDDDQPTLAEALSRNGYATAAFFSNPWLADRTTGLLRGFAEQKEAPVSGGLPGDPGTWRGDQGGRASVSFFRNWVRDRPSGKPFFAFVNLLEAHLPYDPPPNIRQAPFPVSGPGEQVTGQWGMEYQAGLHPFDEVDWDRLRNLYWGDVAMVDHLLLGIISALKESGLEEDTILIVCSDHGENLGDHRLNDHQFSVHETLLAVPLLIRAPGRLPVGRRGDPVLLSDLFATVEDLAGIRATPPVHSRSLLGEPAPPTRPLVAEYARPQARLVDSLVQLNPSLDRDRLERGLRTIRVGHLRLTLADDGEVQLNDLSRDPRQEQDISAEAPDKVKALRALLDRELSIYRPGRGSRAELDEATLKQLRSLGYVH